MNPIELIDINKSFFNQKNKNELSILHNLNLTIEQGKSIAVIGKSGSGKSTLLHLAGGLDSPTSGKVIINNQDLSLLNDVEKSKIRNKFLGFIFQSNLLLDDFTALENVIIPSLIAGYSRNESLERAHYLLSNLGLSDREKHYPSQMSGGEKQRVSICRALINNSVQVILADEPTGSLDEENENEVEDLLLDLVKKEGKSLLLVTHNNDFACKCDKVYTLKNKNLTEGIE